MPNPIKKLPLEIQSLARSYTEAGIRVLGGYVGADECDPDIRIRAIAMLFDRGWGRPISKTEVAGKDGEDIRVVIRTIIEGKK